VMAYSGELNRRLQNWIEEIEEAESGGDVSALNYWVKIYWQRYSELLESLRMEKDR
jgi:hypothetical protein